MQNIAKYVQLNTRLDNAFILLPANLIFREK